MEKFCYERRSETKHVGPMSDQEIERLLTTREVARLLGISDRTLSKLVKSGEIMSLKLRNSRRFDPIDVRAYIDKCKKGTGV